MSTKAEKNLKAIQAMQETAKLETAVNVTARDAMRAYIAGNMNAYGESILQLATIITHVRLNKMLASESECASNIQSLKKDVTLFAKYNEKCEQLASLYTYETVTVNGKKEYVLDRNGDLIEHCSDKKRANDIMQELNSFKCMNGNDLVQECACRLLKCVESLSKCSILDENSLVSVFAVYDKRSMFSKNGDIKSRLEWSKVPTNAIKEGGKSVSRLVFANKAVRESNELYTRIERNVSDENGEQRTVESYKKASVLSSYEITDFNGKLLAVSSNDDDNSLMESIPEKANLTVREAYILKNHYVPHAYPMKDENGKTVKNEKTGKPVYTFGVLSLEQIAKHFGVTERAIQFSDENMKKKVINANIFPEYYGVERKKQTEKKEVICYRANDETKTIIARFESAKKASEILGIDRGLIVNVANGKRKTANGLKFEYVE